MKKVEYVWSEADQWREGFCVCPVLEALELLGFVVMQGTESLPWWLNGLKKKGKKKVYLAMQKTQDMRVRSLGWEDLLEKEMAAHFSILAWEILWMEEPGGLQSMGSQSTGHDLATKQQGTGQMKRALIMGFLNALV